MEWQADDRHKQRAGLILLFFLICSSWASAQEAGGSPQQNPSPSTPPQAQTISGKDLAPKQFLRTIWSDQKVMWTSPFRMNGRQALTIALPLVAGTAGLIQVDEDAAKGLPNTDDQVTVEQASLPDWDCLYAGWNRGRHDAGRKKEK